MHTYAVGLHDGCVAVDVDDEAGEVVALAVYKTVGVVVVARRDACALTEVVGGGDAAVPEGLVDGLVIEGEDAHGDAAHLHVTACDELMVVCVHCHHVALLGFALDALDGARENPGVEALQ